MAVKKGGLGRGLESLFADTGSGTIEAEKETSALLLREIEPDKEQPRKIFDESALSELSKSIQEHGVLQPIVVRPLPSGGYRIVAGERRWRAARLAGLKEIPALVKDLTESQAMEIALVENLQREDLDPIEEAMGYKALMEKCGLTQEQTAERVSKSRSAIANSLRLLSLPSSVVEQIQNGFLSTGHAKAILSISDKEQQLQAAEIIMQDKLNVRQAESLCKRIQKPVPKNQPKVHRPALAAEIEISLRDVLGSEVKVQYQDGKGSLTVGFYSDQQLQQFANLLGEYKQ